MKNVKSLLKSGDIVVLENKEMYKVFADYELTYYHGLGIFSKLTGFGHIPLPHYNNDLTNRSGNKSYDVVKIYRARIDNFLMSTDLHCYDLIWEREEIKEMTMQEICEALGYEVKIKKEEK